VTAASGHEFTPNGAKSSDVALAVCAAAALHAAAAVFLFSQAKPRPALPRVLPMRTHMVAAPRAEVSVGVVQAPVAPVEKPAPRAAEKIPDPTKTAPTATKQAPRIKPKQATVTPNAAKAVKDAPTAGSEAGGKGADLANVDLGGTDFPYPAYQRNIVNRIAENFRTNERGRNAEVQFIIRRDGSVDPDQMQLVTRSGSYTFDNAAMGAIEAAANKKLFGPLPADFKNDALTVIFRFDPAIIRPQ
jgi:outer membrane biosynthesis protein TonB